MVHLWMKVLSNLRYQMHQQVSTKYYYVFARNTRCSFRVASGEDPAFTPKARKEMMGGYHSHPTTPQSTVPSPGAASINSIHEEYPDMNSPGWPRTPASPVCILFHS